VIFVVNTIYEPNCWTDVQLKQVKHPRTALFLETESEQANGLSGFDSRK